MLATSADDVMIEIKIRIHVGKPFSRSFPQKVSIEALYFFQKKATFDCAVMKKVLVIDNDQAFRSQLAPWLGERGWTLLDAPDNQRGMELALQHKPEIVLCDLLSPHCNGIQFCRDLRRQKDQGRRTALHHCHRRRHATDKINALEAGADEYMAKPVHFTALDKHSGAI